MGTNFFRIVNYPAIKTKRERYLVDDVPAHLAITVVIGQCQVTVIMAVRSRSSFRMIGTEPGSFWLAVAGFSADEPLLVTLAAMLH